MSGDWSSSCAGPRAKLQLRNKKRSTAESLICSTFALSREGKISFSSMKKQHQSPPKRAYSPEPMCDGCSKTFKSRTAAFFSHVANCSKLTTKAHAISRPAFRAAPPAVRRPRETRPVPPPPPAVTARRPVERHRSREDRDQDQDDDDDEEEREEAARRRVRTDPPPRRAQDEPFPLRQPRLQRPLAAERPRLLDEEIERAPRPEPPSVRHEPEEAGWAAAFRSIASPAVPEAVPSPAVPDPLAATARPLPVHIDPAPRRWQGDPQMQGWLCISEAQAYGTCFLPYETDVLGVS